MSAPQKETIVLVHGTQFGSRARAIGWHQPTVGSFVRKLDAVLRNRGSSARCWAHCEDDAKAFAWTGQNDWVARANAANELAAYLRQLSANGWRYHIIAHSHGGNVLAEALRRHTENAKTPGLGKVITMGTPFVDLEAAIAQSNRGRQNVLAGFALILACLFSLSLAVALFTLQTEVLVPTAFVIALFASAYGVHRARQNRKARSTKAPSEPTPRPIWLALGSSKDEAWQALRHLSSSPNPLVIKGSLVSHLVTAYARDRTARAETDLRKHGTIRQNGFLGYFGLFLAAVIYLFAAAGIAVVVTEAFNSEISLHSLLANQKISGAAGSVLFLLVMAAVVFSLYLEAAFWPAFVLPARLIGRECGALASIIFAMGTYVIRRASWPVIVRMAMGLDGYRFRIPAIQKQPANFDTNMVAYENIPEFVEDTTLHHRGEWAAKRIRTITEAFAKDLITPLDVAALLQELGSDQTLVHAAYYTHDACIERIAEWIVSE